MMRLFRKERMWRSHELKPSYDVAIYLDQIGQTRLMAALTALLHDSDSIVASRLIDGELGPQVQEGYQSI